MTSVMTSELPLRSHVPLQDQWDITHLYPSFAQWEKEFNTIKPDTPLWKKFLSCKGKLGQSIEIFKEALTSKLEIERALEKLYTYAHLRHDEDILEESAKNAYERICALSTDFQSQASWFEPEIFALSHETVSNIIYSPELSSYRFYLEKILRMRPYTLSTREEEILALCAKPLRTISKAFSSLNNADIKFKNIKDSQGKEHPLSHGLYQTYLRSQDRVLRENAFKEMHFQFANLENTLAELISGEIEKHVFSARVRGFKSSLQAALFPHNIPEQVYTSLINCVRKGLPLLHRYVTLRKKIMNLSQIHPYDMYVPLVKEVDFSMDYTQAERVTIESSSFLGTEYQNLLEQGLLKEKWVDRYENKNKRSGAYSSGCYDSFPYILMNFRGTLKDVFTLAHEAGHSMHSLLSHKTQNYHDASYPIFVAEVASTFNEELLMHYLLEKAQTQEERLFLINEKIEDIRGTFFRQCMFAEFELELHELVEEGIPLTAQLIKEKYYQLNKAYFGNEMTLDEELAVEWARIPHFYYNFYVYQYATGISAALSLTEKVLQGDPKAAKNYLSFLKSGGSLFPIDLLKIAGIDMTNSSSIEAILRTFSSLIDQLEKIIFKS